MHGVVVVVVTALKTFLFIHFFAGKEFCGSQKYFDDDEISSGGTRSSSSNINLIETRATRWIDYFSTFGGLQQ